jgi:hypothetical protein
MSSPTRKEREGCPSRLLGHRAPYTIAEQAAASKSIHPPYIRAANHYAVRSVSTVASFDLVQAISLVN